MKSIMWRLPALPKKERKSLWTLVKHTYSQTTFTELFSFLGLRVCSVLTSYVYRQCSLTGLRGWSLNSSRLTTLLLFKLALRLKQGDTVVQTIVALWLLVSLLLLNWPPRNHDPVLPGGLVEPHSQWQLSYI